MRAQKRFFISKQLILQCGLLLLLSSLLLTLISVKIASRGIIETVENDMSEKARDTAKIIDTRLLMLFRFVINLTRLPLINDDAVSIDEKQNELNLWKNNLQYIITINYHTALGIRYKAGGKVVNNSKKGWFIEACKGKPYLTEPFFSKSLKEMIHVLSVPVLAKNGKLIGVIACTVKGE